MAVALIALGVACAKSGGGSGFASPSSVSSIGGDDASTGGDDDATTVSFGNDATLFIPAKSSGGDGGDAGGPCDGGPCGDFPAAPLIDPNGPVTGSPAFGDAGAGTTTSGPCLVEPADGALYPYNWLRPRVLWTPGTKEQTTFEVRIHADLEQNDYVVYTTKNYWTMDKATWQTVAGIPGGNPGTLVNQVLSVTVRALGSGGGTPAISNTARFQIAPAIADGSLIYWTTPSFDAGVATTLQGFHVGDEGTVTALTPAEVAQPVWAGPGDGGNFPIPPILEPVACIGCHTSTPDGVYVGFTAQWPWPNAIASVQADGGTPVGAAPPWLTQNAIDNLGPNTNDANYLGGMHVTATNNVDNVMLGIQTFSPAHYATGDRIEITSVGASKDQPETNGVLEQIQPSGVTSQLIWINLEFTGATDAGRPSAAAGAPNNGGWGILARTGDTNSAGAPAWSQDGNTVAYTSVKGGTMDGRLDQPTSGSADIMTIPYDGGKGGPASAVKGAADPAYNEYFPAFSPDDALIAFNRVGSTASMYSQPLAEVFVVPVSGPAAGTAVRLEANDPVQCTNLVSPGVQNTWPKWAPNPIFSGPDAGADAGPAPQVINGFTYYWLTFSSTRSPTAAGHQQLYVAGVVVDPAGSVRTYAPIYLWNQSDEVNNLIPSWGEFAIPPGQAPPPPPPPPAPPK
jgi:hypothetical protein